MKGDPPIGSIDIWEVVPANVLLPLLHSRVVRVAVILFKEKNFFTMDKWLDPLPSSCALTRSYLSTYLVSSWSKHFTTVRDPEKDETFNKVRSLTFYIQESSIKMGLVNLIRAFHNRAVRNSWECCSSQLARSSKSRCCHLTRHTTMKGDRPGVFVEFIVLLRTGRTGADACYQNPLPGILVTFFR